MKISEKWLRSFVEINKPIQEIAEILTLRGLEVENILPVAETLDHVVVAEIISAEKHPNADRLRVCQVNSGHETLTIVCGAPNARAGIKVVLAKIGAVLPQVTIKKSKIRGVESHGMLCSMIELGLAEKSEAEQSQGIMELPLDAPVGQAFVEYLELDDHILDISITPNRGDCASVLGIAREVAAIHGATWLSTTSTNIEINADTSNNVIKINNEAPEVCPTYFATKIVGIDATAKTPIWMKERLRRSGVRSISLPVDVTNYVMLECGQPLHAFDAQKLQGDICIRFAYPQETLELLNGLTINLDEKTLIIADAAGPIALAGIMGGARTAVSETTTDILLECAHFIPTSIARTARYFNISSDSAYRFERGVDPQLPASALAQAAMQIVAVAGGMVVASTERCEYSSPKTIFLRYSKLEKVLGVKIISSQIKQYFSALNLAFEETLEGLRVTPPSYRFDLHIEEDLIEEVLRMHGNDAVTEIAPQPQLSLQANLTSTHVDAERLILKTRGYDEIISYSFVDEKLHKQLFPEVTALRLINPISHEMGVMRTSLWTGLMTTLLYNINRQQTRVHIFEVGLCFNQDNVQPKKIAGLSYGALLPESLGNDKEIVDFFDVKNDLLAILAENGVADDYEFLPLQQTALHPTQSAKIVHKQSKAILGEIGVLHPRLVQAFDLPKAPVLFELDVEILRTYTGHKRFTPLSKFPEVRRDLSFLVPQHMLYQDLVDSVKKIDKERIQRVFIFDVYQGKGVPEGKKSIAIALIIQDAHKTLTDDEVACLVKKVIDLIESDFDASLRE